MPPKKGKAAAKATTGTPVKASTRSERPTAPATVTNKHGKEFETTAALGRPHRATVPAAAPSSPPKVTAKAATKAVAKTSTKTKPAAKMPTTEAMSPAAAKKRGRPAKTAVTEDEPAAKRSRASKQLEAVELAAPAAQSIRKPGRPAKAAIAKLADSDKADDAAAAPLPRKRGRPAKASRAKEIEPEEAPDALDTPAPRKRGRGPKGGETTKISTDDADAADQLEEELIDVAEEAAKPGRKRKAPDEKNDAPSKAKAKGKAVQATEVAEDAPAEGRTYWLMKAEQVDRVVTLNSGREFNTKFTIDDLKAADAPEPWDGVRNMVARNNMRNMKKGDLAFFYASQGKGKLQPGITGVMEVVREHEPDQTVSDEDSYGFVEPNKRGTENQWSVVHVAFRKKLSKPVTLKELQKFGGSGGILGDMQLLRQARLSVAKVTEKEWDFIVNELIDGYEDEVETKGTAEDTAETSADTTATNIDQKLQPTLSVETPVHERNAVAPYKTDNGELPTAVPTLIAANTSSRPPSRATSRQASLTPPVQSTETTITTVEIPIDSAAPTSSLTGSLKPASRAGSKKPTSRAPSVKPASRAGSLAPPNRPTSRGRSRTPKPHAAAGSGQPMDSLLEENITTDQLDLIIE